MFEPLEARQLLADGDEFRIYTPPVYFEPPVSLADDPAGPVALGTSLESTLANPHAAFSIRSDSAGGWIGAGYAEELAGADRYATFSDPKDRQTYVIAFGDLGSTDAPAAAVLYRQSADGALTDRRVLYTDSAEAIRARIVTFMSPDSRVHVAGVNRSGAIVMFYQSGARNEDGSWAWSADNISQNQLFPQGLATPEWASPATAYVTPWGGLNVAAIDSDGQLNVIWWAPGMQHWSVDNLTALAHGPALHQYMPPSSLVTPWGGINVFGLDGGGNVWAYWWVPGTEPRGSTRGWQANMLNPDIGEGRLWQGVTAYVTPWGALNVAGADYSTGRPVVYWWVPGQRDWTRSVVEIGDESESTSWPSRVVALMRGSEQNLVGTAENGDVIRLSWRPESGTIWTLENLTELAQQP